MEIAWQTYKDTRFQALQSLCKSEFETLLADFQPIVESYFRYHTLKGEKRVHPMYQEPPNTSLVGAESKLFFILCYLKNNALQELIGAYFHMSQGKVSMWAKQLLPLLKSALQKTGLVPTEDVSELYARLAAHGEEVVLIQDATTRPIERPTDAQVQKEHYDGKHKMHTIKNHLVTQTDKKIVYASPLYEGSVHDKKLIEEEKLAFPKQVVVIQDLGFQGFGPGECTVIMPEKKKREQPLSGLDKALNQLISSCRIIVENVIGSVKVLRILKDKIRIRGRDKRQDVFLIGCALHNLKLKSQPSQKNS